MQGTIHKNGSLTQNKGFAIAITVPDLNPIESPWDELKMRVHMHRPRNLKDLERYCMEEWSQIPCHVFTNLIMHYNRRLRAVILAKRGCTKY